MSNNVRQKIMVICIAFVVGGLMVCNNFIIKPYVVESKKIGESKGVEDKKRTLIQEIVSANKRKASYSSFLAESKDPSWFISAVNDAAVASGITLISVTPARPEELSGFERLSMLLEAKGDYHALGDFVSRLESHPKFIWVNRLHATSSEKNPALTVSMQLYSLFPMPEAA